MRLSLKLGDGEWEYDDNELDLADAFAIKSASGLGLAAFMQGVIDFEPLAIQTLLWFVRHKEEPKLRRESINFKIADLDLEFLDQARPTKAPGSTRPGARSTSTRSRAGAASRQRKSTR